jgi:hypothetical protein
MDPDQSHFKCSYSRLCLKKRKQKKIKENKRVVDANQRRFQTRINVASKRDYSQLGLWGRLGLWPVGEGGRGYVCTRVFMPSRKTHELLRLPRPMYVCIYTLLFAEYACNTRTHIQIDMFLYSDQHPLKCSFSRLYVYPGSTHTHIRTHAYYTHIYTHKMYIDVCVRKRVCVCVFARAHVCVGAGGELGI